MLELLTTKTSPIGLDIGQNSIKMLQMRLDGERIIVTAADERQLNPEVSEDEQERTEAIVAAIKEILVRGEFHNREVITCLPSSELIIKSLRLDTGDEREIERALKAGIIERSGLKADEYEVRFMSAGNIRQGDEIKSEVILFAIRKEALDKHIHILKQAGVKPVAIDTVPCALFRSLQRSLRRTADMEKTNVFVDIGASHTTVIIGRAGEIIFAKQIDIAGSQITKQVASRLGIGLEEAMHLRSKLRNEIEAQEIEAAAKQAVVDSMYSVIDELAREISLCFRYYAVTFRGQRPGQVIFAGGEAYEETLVKALERHLGIEIEITEPLKGFDISNVKFPAEKNAVLCEWAVAAGLCLKGLNLTDTQKSYERN
ncbi:MAG: type IV pilus assembly protein PilM [Phycisphaerae bacterium]|nr:type IV pilus assembly protein PilM [Phycisphaerae bacterium]